jgi:AhpD family alkylhydroperoxidase
MTEETERPALNEKDCEIIAVGASVAAGCLPCTKFHVRAASAVGAASREILLAVRDAVRVRGAAASVMAKAGGLSPDETDLPDQGPDEARSLIRELVMVSAAYAVSCTTGLGTHMAAARALGATDKQLFTAVRIACEIRDVAVQKAKAAVGAVLGVSEEKALTCGCGEVDASADESCECRTGDQRRSE